MCLMNQFVDCVSVQRSWRLCSADIRQCQWVVGACCFEITTLSWDILQCSSGDTVPYRRNTRPHLCGCHVEITLHTSVRGFVSVNSTVIARRLRWSSVYRCPVVNNTALLLRIYRHSITLPQSCLAVTVWSWNVFIQCHIWYAIIFHCNDG